MRPRAGWRADGDLGQVGAHKRRGIQLDSKPVDLEAIKSRLIKAGYPRPDPGRTSSTVRETSGEAQRARAELRDHIVEDLWALLDEVEALRRLAERE